MSAGLEIDTTDPAVRRLMGLEHNAQQEFARDVERRPADRELVHLAGDPDTGMSNTIHLDHGKHEVFVHYRGRYTPPEFPDGLRMTVDVYALPEEPLQVHLVCPKCRHQLRVTSDRKTIEWEPNPHDPDGGKLSISPFVCTWEMPEAGEHVAGILGGGLSLCQWKGVLENVHGKNWARDA